MIDASLSVSEGPVTRTVRVRAASLARAMEIAGRGKPGVCVRLSGPVAPITMAAGPGASAAGELAARAA